MLEEGGVGKVEAEGAREEKASVLIGTEGN